MKVRCSIHTILWRKTNIYTGKKLVANQQIKSLLDVKDIDGKLAHAKRSGVHPNTNFNALSGGGSENDSSDEERMDDIVKAQSLSLRLSRIKSDPLKSRCLQIILRGNYEKLDQEAKEGYRRQKLYMVATDISEEAAYALEWTIGTVLRDGDTLFAVYAMDIADVGGDAADTQSTSSAMAAAEQQNAASSGDGPKLMEDTYSMVRVLSNNMERTVAGSSQNLDPLSALKADLSRSRPSSTGRSSSFASPDVRGMGRAERERVKAVEAIGERCVHLLRQTKLQVRICIDVIHSKSPRHIITEIVSLCQGVLENTLTDVYRLITCRLRW